MARGNLGRPSEVKSVVNVFLTYAYMQCRMSRWHGPATGQHRECIAAAVCASVRSGTSGVWLVISLMAITYMIGYFTVDK